MNVLDFYTKKQKGDKISMITCYDYTSARLLAETPVDCLLVGDSVAMTMHGYKDTLSATLEMMCFHTSAVSRGAGNKFIVGDMPFLSYRKSLSKNVTAAQVLMQAGAHAVKLECAAGNAKLVRHLTESGIPVMGHLGLTPQSVYALGGYKVQGKTQESAARLKEDALILQEAGCFAIVLECVPAPLAKTVTQQLSVPTIGIGAGPDTDGQVLVFQDLLGLNQDFKPKFVKAFVNGYEQLKQGIETYISAVKSGEFPQHEHCFEN
ncbi:3-methyl-2-oxobutanoate hydroxymethyltransferase [Aquicella lusitana]|uniref:3-methyl-2-oxobutanoate hydroxymethyltransferase n=1 Tax=Aquicella lusitana TaxID=254246 RepID=A0A370GZK7_9COXI|nr:3-methyl-2-oxobutanoate hydroxymethyltransferase [Aquicella lusitana]RDI48104.1 ketopantoate hydroxymethyltransferase [Aquicella lusitana]VVC72880.1 3-methyl-2-oxobutanoate hydroxymethyltransferase [Aquicella lusitana]